MGTSSQKIIDAAKFIDTAVVNHQEIASLRTEYPFNLKEAYQIQEQGIALREARGEKRVGVKLGFTSRAKMQQMGVDHLIWGVLTDAMRLEEGGNLFLSNYIHPRIEPEVGFITKKEIATPLTLAEALQVIEGIFPAMEVIDSRYQKFKFSLEDVVADNTSSAGFILGNLCSPKTAISNCGVILSANGRLVEAGSTAAILGDPLRALVQISELLYANEQVLPAGSIIMAGAATAAYSMKAGDTIETQVTGLGRVCIHAQN